MEREGKAMVTRTLTAMAATCLLSLGAGACGSSSSDDRTGASQERSEAEPEIQEPWIRDVPVHRVLGLHADWQIPDSVPDLMRIMDDPDPESHVLALPTGASLGNEYNFDEGRGGSLGSVYLTAEVQEASTPGVSPGDTVIVELHTVRDVTAAQLEQIDFGAEPWVFLVDEDGLFDGSNVTSTRDLDSAPNPDSIGAVYYVAAFEVTDARVTLPLLGERALRDESVTSTEQLSDEIEAALQGVD